MLHVRVGHLSRSSEGVLFAAAEFHLALASFLIMDQFDATENREVKASNSRPEINLPSSFFI